MNSFGVYGVGVMGRGLALNLASKGHRVAIFNKEVDRMWDIISDARKENIHTVKGYPTVKEFMESLERPKKVLMMVPAGDAVDQVIHNMAPYISEGDIIIDGSNEWYPKTQHRQDALYLDHGAHLIGMGVSGGAHGARHGAAFMPGGRSEAIEAVLPFLESASDPNSLTAYIGKAGSGNYVKMVHNGIEYALMQIIAEVYDALKKLYGLDNAAISMVFKECNRTLQSFLLDITVDILNKKDDQGSNAPLLDMVLDVARMNGTGTWTAKDALEVLVPCPSIAAAVDARLFSKDLESRTALSCVFPTSVDNMQSLPLEEFMASSQYTMIRAVLVTAMHMAYLQGFLLMQQRSMQSNWDINIAHVAQCWMGGCIIRSDLLNFFASTPEDLLKQHAFHDVSHHFTHYVEFVSKCVMSHVPTPVLCATYQYMLGSTTLASSANLIQAQRDYFGAHGYERVDLPGKRVTSNWR